MLYDRLPSWFAPRSADQDQARREYLLNLVLLGLAGPGFLFGLALFIGWLMGKVPIGGALAGFGVQPFYALAYWMGRRGKVRAAAFVPVVTVWLTMAAGSIQFGVNSTTLIGYAMAVLTAGMLIGSSAAFGFAILSTLTYLVLGLREVSVGPVYTLPPQVFVASNTAGTALGLIVMVALSWLFTREVHRALIRSLAEARRREQESAESIAAQQKLTAELQATNQAQAQTLDELERVNKREAEMRRRLQSLRNPVIPIWEGVVVMPLAGRIEAEQSESVARTLLRGVERENARVAILDITGVPEVDEQAIHTLLQAANATELMGCQPVLTGLRPEFAQALIALGVDLGGVVTRSDLQAGVAYALSRLELSVNKKE
jgi:rsbT co-antagonist protein RsbR